MELKLLADKVFGGSANLLFAPMLNEKQLTSEEVKRLRIMVDEME